MKEDFLSVGAGMLTGSVAYVSVDFTDVVLQIVIALVIAFGTGFAAYYGQKYAKKIDAKKQKKNEDTTK